VLVLVFPNEKGAGGAVVVLAAIPEFVVPPPNTKVLFEEDEGVVLLVDPNLKLLVVSSFVSEVVLAVRVATGLEEALPNLKMGVAPL